MGEDKRGSRESEGRMSDNAFLIGVLLIIVASMILFHGEPDIIDAIIHNLMGDA